MGVGMKRTTIRNLNLAPVKTEEFTLDELKSLPFQYRMPAAGYKRVTIADLNSHFAIDPYNAKHPNEPIELTNIPLEKYFGDIPIRVLHHIAFVRKLDVVLDVIKIQRKKDPILIAHEWEFSYSIHHYRDPNNTSKNVFDKCYLPICYFIDMWE
jgi:3',5'-cyclic AMP phosphodiesterase CpdA